MCVDGDFLTQTDSSSPTSSSNSSTNTDTSTSTTSSTVPNIDVHVPIDVVPVAVVHPRSYASEVLNTTTTGPVSHSDFGRSMYMPIRAESRHRESQRCDSSRNSSSSRTTTRGTKRPNKHRNIRGTKHRGSPSGSPCPKLPVPQYLRSNTEMTTSHLRRYSHDKPTTPAEMHNSHLILQDKAKCHSKWQIPQSGPAYSYQMHQASSHKPPRKHQTSPYCQAQTCQATSHLACGLPPIENSTCAPVPRSVVHDGKQSTEVKLPRLGPNLKGHLTTDETVTSVESPQHETRGNNAQGTDETSPEEMYFVTGHNVMCGHDNTQVVHNITQQKIRIQVHVYDSQSKPSSSHSRKSKSRSAKRHRQHRDS